MFFYIDVLLKDKQLNNKTTKQPDNKLCLEDNTEQSESNPGHSLGIYEDIHTAVWKTVPKSGIMQ